jgi:hypothetical protein
MNIFRLDKKYSLSAIYHCDKHVVKMILEQTQLLHTALHTRGFRADWLYKPFNPKHPSCRWTMETRGNFDWVANHGLSLCIEYASRYGKHHKCFELLGKARKHIDVMPAGKETPQLLAMPEQFKTDDVVHSYRLYYAGAKFRFAKWKTFTPCWWDEYRQYVIKNNLEIINDKQDGVSV